jgi:hypothetical protein
MVVRFEARRAVSITQLYRPRRGYWVCGKLSSGDGVVQLGHERDAPRRAAITLVTRKNPFVAGTPRF